MRMRIERAEVIPLEVPLTRTFYGGTYSMNRRCTLLLRVWTAEGIRGQIYIGMNATSRQPCVAFYATNCFQACWGVRPVR